MITATELLPIFALRWIGPKAIRPSRHCDLSPIPIGSSLVPLQLALPPMCVFARGIKPPNVAAVQCSRHANARHHGGAAQLDDQQQGFYRGLPLLKILLGLRKLHDVVGGIAQSHELAPTR